ncbi:undecaprenyldiphospho-muramoylpentapeptide beta-N-acetylglucosaminyltransferase [Clostridium sp. D2Q-11]|uniref:UDP-N-acetylglucosamine--N-acetylmuramyl-(pentapeptide) pyrophosphoryl-undecaprenol N-acetylglucosamine transferase n=1 Tax=Anaeromonas frigoriresistens TaxID=2683708 RepID=A0A942UZV6_9FIRM|nr:undecaprenyldiphospho-muramoylpentapeptide beta-N-acetylglucosaminyltransferase [Anaeromonas frigoriresistens]MBS4540086.1 undecaprenyldiphospho-muramoylpentapeptide beta-N-acetylglucosaminyltransferase [Anaeromonas frigoriresistens]
MKFLITGGGTGGHISPALAIAKKIREKNSEAEILYVGTHNSMESELVPREGFNFKGIRVKGFERKLSIDTAKSVKELFLGLNDARKVIKEFSPDVVVGTGGYVCGPVVFMASLKNIPTLIHEQNALPGATNRILSKFVDRIAASFEESKKYFKNSEKVTITGNPVKIDFFNVNKDEAYKELNIDKHRKFVISLGGSGGQKSLNDSVVGIIEKNINNHDIQLLHITGKRHYETFMKQLRSKGIKTLPENIKVLPYFYDMPKGLSIADLVITSAGAITLAEVTATGIPSIIIPKGYTTGNHQEFNARAIEKAEAGIMILDSEVTGDKLNYELTTLLQDEDKLDKMAINSKKLGNRDSTDRIYNIILELI